MKKLLILFAIVLFMVCSCVSPQSPVIKGEFIQELAKDLDKLDEVVKKANEYLKPKTGYGLSHYKQDPFPLTIPLGHPDFTQWPLVDSRYLNPEIVQLKLAGPSEGYYRLVVCRHEPKEIALHHSHGETDYYWLYKDKVPVEVTKEKFDKKVTEAQYLCSGKEKEV